MKKYFSLLAALGCLLVASCSKDSSDETDFKAPTTTGYYVINQGNFYDNISGSLSYGDFGGSLTELTLSGAALGDTPENGVIWGELLCIPCNASSDLAVINTTDGSLVKRIHLTEPQAACADSRYVYATESDGHLARIDMKTFSIDRLEVGASPYACVYTNGKVYVNCAPWAPDWSAPVGRTVAVVDAESFTKTADITVGLNPYDQMTVDGKGNVYTVCCGDYGATLPEVWQITPDGKARKYADGNIIACHPTEPLLYVINSQTDYSNYPEVSVKSTFTCLDTSTDSPKVFCVAEADMPASPIAASVCPRDGSLYVTSDGAAGAYSSLGTLSIYSPQGVRTALLHTGVHPYYIVWR